MLLPAWNNTSPACPRLLLLYDGEAKHRLLFWTAYWFGGILCLIISRCWDSELSCVARTSNQPAISKIFLLLLITLQGDCKTVFMAISELSMPGGKIWEWLATFANQSIPVIVSMFLCLPCARLLGRCLQLPFSQLFWAAILTWEGKES